ncbi:MAG TPA: DUF1206 domain-containing protein [Segeticoccus sp.]|nr:DUF1206 domain-containing protein [Segeticoccus sp.]
MGSEGAPTPQRGSGADGSDDVDQEIEQEVERAADETSEHPAVRWPARAGMVVSALLHLLIAWVGFRVAVGSTGHQASQSGALQTIASTPGGEVVLWLGAVGFLAFAVWEVADAIRDRKRRRRDNGWLDVAKSAATAVVHLVIGVACLRFALGQPSDSRHSSRELTAVLLQHPGGRALVGVIGLTVVGVGVYHGYKGVTRGFLSDLSGEPNPASTTAGVVGYLAKGLAVALVGGLFVAAAVHHRARQASGLDGALRDLQQEPYGVVLLGAVAAGLAAYGLYTLTTVHRRV